MSSESTCISLTALTQYLAQHNNDGKNPWHLVRTMCPAQGIHPHRTLICHSPLREAVSFIPILGMRNRSCRKEAAFGLRQSA